MGYFDQIQQYTNGVVKKFNKAGAIDRKHAVPLDKLKLTAEEKMIGLRYLKGFMAVRKTKGNYYLNAKRLKNPMMGYSLRALLIFAIVIPAMFAFLFLFGYILSFF